MKFIKLACLLAPAMLMAAIAKGQDLKTALKDNDTVTALKLIRAGADVNKPFDDGNTPLITYCRWGSNAQMVSFLLRHGAKADAGRSAGGRTPLIVACAYYGGLPVVKLLVEHGANVNAAANDGSTALMQAAHNAKVGVVKYLISKKAHTGAKDKKGDTALEYAKKATELEYIKGSVKDDVIDQAEVIKVLESAKKQLRQKPGI